MVKLWFRAKKYGWGWYPGTWQGWLVILLYLIVVFGAIKLFPDPFRFEIIIGLATLVLLVVCYKTGEKPRWRWGK